MVNDMHKDIIDSHIQKQQALAKLYSPSPALSAIADSLKPIQAIADSLRPIRAIAEVTASLRYITIPSYISDISRMTNWIKSSQLQIQSFNSLQLLADEQRRFSKNLSSIVGTFNNMHESLKASAAWNLRNTIEEAIGPSLFLQQQLGNALGTHKWVHEISSFNSFIPKIEHFLANFPTEKISVGDGGSLAVAGQTFTINEINDTVSEIIDNIDAAEEDVKGFFDLFFKELDKLAKPLKTILIWVILPFIISVTASLATPHLKNLINKQTIIREIKKKTPQRFDSEMLSNFRFVTATILFVREGPSQNTKILDEIQLGQVVHIIHKKKNWTQVGYIDQDTGEM